MGEVGKATIAEPAAERAKNDELLEWQFVKDYGEFALQMNFLTCAALLEKARTTENPVKRKSVCLSGLQLLYSSYEDFAILLHAFRNRMKGKHLHLSIGVEDQPRAGTTEMPRIFKHYESARQMLDNFGFTSINHELLFKYIEITEQELEEHYKDIANSIRGLGQYQGTINDYKNKLKHGKPVLEGEVNKSRPDYVLFLRWSEEDNKSVLEMHWVNASLQQLEMALIQIAKIYIRSLEFLWLFMLHYYPDHAEQFREETMVACSRDVVEHVRSLGVESKGLT